MSVREFMKAFERKLKTHNKLKWQVSAYIRGYATDQHRQYCPIEFVAGVEGAYLAGESILRLRKSSAYSIIDAADGKPGRIRNQLLKIVAPYVR